MDVNTHLLLEINGWAGKNNLLDGFMVFCAEYLIYIVFALAGIWFVYAVYRRSWQSAAFFAVNLVISFILLHVAGHLYVDHRPFVDYNLTQLIPHAAGRSFPSDHATASTAVAIGFLGFTRFKKAGVLLFLLALLIGFARIFAGVHYPVDILGGVLTALVGGLLALILFELSKQKNMRDEKPTE